MTRYLIILMLTVTMLTPATMAFAIKIGTAAPNFTLKDTTGKAVSLSSFRGKTVVLNFWGTNCPPCLAELPSLENLHRELGRSGVEVVGVVLDKDADAVKRIMAHDKLGYPVLLDPGKDVYFDSYGLFGLPITLIISKEGIVVDRVIGEAVWDSPAMKEKIAKIR